MIEQVVEELARAAEKYPTWPTDPLHALAVLGEEYGELTKAVLQHTYEPHKASIIDVRMEAIQTAAMALRFAMSLDRYEYCRCEQHQQSGVPAPKKQRIYISGPMSGLPEHNFPAFNAEASRLRKLGYEVVNPAELNPDPGKTWKDCLRVDLLELLACDAIAMLPGWQKSEGAHLEMHVAHRVGIEIMDAATIDH